MGGRGASKGGRVGGGGGLNPADILDTRSLISDREANQSLVDQTLQTLRDVNREFGEEVADISLATLSKKAQSAMAYSDGYSIGVNENYFSDRAESAYDDCVKSGWHPPKGNKTAMQAIVAHELGHNLTMRIAEKLGVGSMDTAAMQIVNQARRTTGDRGNVIMARKISEYATASNAETVAEAYADVYCNGSRAKAQSYR